MTHTSRICHICDNQLNPAHDPEDCPLWDTHHYPHWRRIGCVTMILAAIGSWTLVFLLIYWLQTSGILDAIDNWKAPWQ